MTIWTGVWTELDWGMDNLDRGMDRIGLGCGQNWATLCTASCTYVRKAL